MMNWLTIKMTSMRAAFGLLSCCRRVQAALGNVEETG